MTRKQIHNARKALNKKQLTVIELIERRNEAWGKVLYKWEKEFNNTKGEPS